MIFIDVAFVISIISHIIINVNVIRYLSIRIINNKY